MKLLRASALLATMVVALSAVHCGPPRQMQPPVIEDTGKKDIVADEPDPKPKASAVASSSGAAPVSSGDADRRAECCAQCKLGLAKDHSGDKPEKIPCAELTSDLNPWCGSYFRKTPTMASECQ